MWTVCRLDHGIYGDYLYGRIQSGCLELRPILPLPQNVHHGNWCGFGTNSFVVEVHTYIVEVSHLCAAYSCSDGGGGEGGMEQVQTAQPR